MTSVEPLLKLEAAKWSHQMLRNLLNVTEMKNKLPNFDKMKEQTKAWKQEGGFKGLEAIAMEQKILNWEKAQVHLARFLACMVEDL